MRVHVSCIHVYVYLNVSHSLDTSSSSFFKIKTKFFLKNSFLYKVFIAYRIDMLYKYFNQTASAICVFYCRGQVCRFLVFEV